MVLLIRIREVSVGGRWPDGSNSQLALLGHRFASVRDTADQVPVGRVRKSRGVRRVRRMSGSKIRVIHRHNDRAILLGHWRDSVRVVRVRQVFLGVEERRQHQRLPVTTRWTHETAAAVSDRELMATAAAPAKIERRAGQAKACLELQKSGPPLFSLTVLEPFQGNVDV